MKSLSGFLLTIWLAFLTVTFVGCTDKPTSVQFFTGTWNELLTEAKKQDKPIFIDVQTVWCGPCRMMEKQAFPNPEIATKFNANFINYRIDMEKGDGPALQKKYAITAVPTLLYLSPEGELIYRSRGYDGINELLADADKAIKAAEAPSELSELEARYKSGERDTEFLRTYLTLRARMGLPNEEAMQAFIQRIPKSEWTLTKNLALITKNTLTDESPSFDHIIRFAGSIKANTAKQNAVWLVVNAAGRVERNELAQAKTEADLDRVISIDHRIGDILSSRPQDAATKAFWANKIRMEFYERTKNQAGYRKLALLAGNRLMAMSIDSLRAADTYSFQQASKRAKLIPVSATVDSTNAEQGQQTVRFGPQSGYVASELNKLTKAYLTMMSAPADLKQALIWSERTVTLSPVWIFIDTHAQVLGKLNRKADAVATAQRAISLAKAAGEDTSDYENTLVKLKQL